jgi:hypothetical protein
MGSHDLVFSRGDTLTAGTTIDQKKRRARPAEEVGAVRVRLLGGFEV